MTKPRKQQISKSDTPYYHCMARCVRRAFLCGQDKLSGKSYEHRRQWVVEQLHWLTSIFAIDICAYAVMSNHYHLVLHLNSSKDWSDREVISRWLQLHKGPLLAQQFLAGDALSEIQQKTLSETAAVWRARLEDLSWFMKCLNEPIARKANAEDECTGHFWEARFKSQALLNDEALLTCMAYVDLNPIRAGIADTPEDSNYTSLQVRLRPAINRKIQKALRKHYSHSFEQFPIKPLFGFESSNSYSSKLYIPCTASSYTKLVDWSGRQMRADKHGSIPGSLPPIFERLHTEVEEWLAGTQQFEQLYHRRFRKVA
ncbi:MAG: transposase [Parahaliea sp.]